MSRPNICADCGASDPTWASVNRGIFLCAQCSSIHRSFGRRFSQIKSLFKNQWSPSQLLMVQTLNNNGVNNIWEHSLVDSNTKFSKRKPQPKDSLHPTKADFIRLKHQQFAFVLRPNRDDTLCTESELGKQLHSSVRTPNLETSLRLLIQGADPNYFHDEKGTTPLHVAAKANQLLQAELLVSYGADPSSPDAHGVTSVEYARMSGNKDLAERLIECMYEVTDRLINFVCGQRPDHHSGKHFVVPEKTTPSDATLILKIQKLSNHLFEELVSDVHDEIDRRETEAIWLSCSDSLEVATVPFLPVDPGLSTTRNQGRQKLGRFNAKELKDLCWDLLNDIKRRQLMSDKDTKQCGSIASNTKQTSQISDDEPLYDSVASDDDYAILTPDSQVTPDKASSSIKEQSVNTSLMSTTSPAAIEVLTRRLLKSDSTISDLRAEVRILQSMVEKLNTENNELRSRLSHTNSEENSVSTGLNSVGHSVNGSNGLDINNFIGETSSLNHINDAQLHSFNSGNKIDNKHSGDLKSLRRGQRPTSMYETREGFRTTSRQPTKNQVKCEENLRPSLTQSMYGGGDFQNLEQNLTKYTEKVTRCIHDLCKCIKTPNKRDDCIQCADKIRIAVIELTTIVPQEAATDNIILLLDSASRLQSECRGFQHASHFGDMKEQEMYAEKVRLCAYDIAKATKALVTKFMYNPKNCTTETSSK